MYTRVRKNIDLNHPYHERNFEVYSCGTAVVSTSETTLFNVYSVTIYTLCCFRVLMSYDV